MTVVNYQSDEIVFAKNTVLTVGTYDGVHCGHQGILEQMRELADNDGGRVVVVTFHPHPQIVLQREGREPVRLLTSIDERCELLEAMGVDVAIIITFTREFAKTTAEDFVRDVAKKIGVQHFFVGHDHMFGRDRGGNEELLQRLSSELEFEVKTLEPLQCDGDVVSSSKIRAALVAGNIESANAMLGRPYNLSGTVVRGDGRGRTIGFPTANIEPVNAYKLVPGNGVYVVSYEFEGRVVKGLANIGRRPTFTTDTETTIEVHFLDLNEDLYDRTITIHFHAFIRNEKKFESAEALTEQIENDRQHAYELSVTH